MILFRNGLSPAIIMMFVVVFFMVLFVMPIAAVLITVMDPDPAAA